jgi:ammonium transporter, Amt family
VARILLLLLAMSGPAWAEGIQSGDTAWMLMSTALVLLMTPALAFFYGGLVPQKNVLNTMMMSLASLGVVGILWVMAGYSIAFGGEHPLIGDTSYLFLNGVGLEAKGNIPHLLFLCFQGSFAVITAALISGAVIGRMSFKAYLVFIACWSMLVYAPMAHWVWGGGWLAGLGALDFAGGTVVHINAGIAALVVTLTLGPREEHGRRALLPHNVPFVLLGTALLWFGWFGFNAGSALEANSVAALAFMNTMAGPMAALLTWMLIDLTRTGKVTAVGAATAVIVGLVAVTPAAGHVTPMSAILIGFLATFPSYYALSVRPRTRLDDSLDVFAGHGLGGISGALLTGVFASSEFGPAGALSGNPKLLGIQAIAVLAAIAFSAAGTWGILKGISLLMPLRASDKEERLGLDITAHGEEAYVTGEGAILLLSDSLPRSVRKKAKSAS